MDIKKLENSQIEMKIIISWEEWKKYIDLAVQDISKEVKVEGFRPGKAPKDIIEKKVGSEAVLNLAAEKAIGKNYPKTVMEEKIEAIGQPRIEVLKIAEGNDLEYKVMTAVMPEVKIGSWEAEVKKVNAKNNKEKVEVSDEEIMGEIKKIAASRVQLVTVAREAKNGDSVEIDFEVSRSGVPIENGSSKKHNLILGKNVFIPGFEENIIGMKEGEEKTFELVFPKEYHAKGLAGKPAVFKVKVNLVQERKTPEVSDEFARSLGKFENLEEFKKNIKEGMLKEKVAKKKEDGRGRALEEVIKKTEADIPKILLDEELHKMIHEFEAQLQGMGMEMSKYLEQMKKTKEDLEEEWKPQAEKRIKASLALEEVAKEKEIEAPHEDIEAEMNKTLQYYKGVKDMEKNIDMAQLYNYTKGMLRNEKVFELLEKL